MQWNIIFLIFFIYNFVFFHFWFCGKLWPGLVYIDFTSCLVNKQNNLMREFVVVFWRHWCVVFVCCRTHRITITNFCLGKHLVSEEDLLKDQRGSPAYISPDVLSGENPASLRERVCVCVCVWLTWLTLHVTTVIKTHKPNHLHGPNQDSSHKPSA